MNRVLIALLVAAFIAIVVGASYLKSGDQNIEVAQEPPPHSSNGEAYAKALSLIEKGNGKEALGIIIDHRSSMEKNDEESNRWLELFVKASAEVSDYRQLMILYRYRPSSFKNNEKASLMVAEAYLATGKMAEFDELREKWKGKESLKDKWLYADADQLILEGKREEAIALLESVSFKGKEDVDRLLRLSLLTLNENPKTAWDYLVEANEKDPDNPTILSYRARLLEATGQAPLALSEYIAATAADPDNLLLRDQLGEFFIRNKRYHQAVQVYEEALTSLPPIDYILLKALFFGKVIAPLDLEVKNDSIPNGRLKRLIEYLNDLPEYAFWNEKLFTAIPNYQKYLDTQQVTWWLRLLSAIKAGNGEKIKELLQYNRFEESNWSPEVSLALKRIVNYRERGELNLEKSPFKVTSLEKESQGEANLTPIGFYKKLNELAEEQEKDPAYKIPEAIDLLLKSPLVFPAALLAVGWDEAALAMQTTKVVPSELPEWVAYGFTQAIRRNRGNMEALEFATLQKQSPTIQLLIGEIMLAQNNNDAAINQLEKLVDEKENVGVRAAWLLTILYLSQKEPEKAKEVIGENEQFANSTLGQEALARIALVEGDLPLADRIYKQIANESSEAKSYLARQAFQEQNWEKAKLLTIELLKSYPNSIILRQNLIKIMQAEKGLYNPAPDRER